MRKIFFLLAILPLSAAASMGSMFGFGPHSMAMGGVNTIQDDASPFNSFSNPAQLGEISNVMISAGYLNMDVHLRSFGTLVLNSNGTQGDFNNSGVMSGSGETLGIAFPIGARTHPLTIAASFYLPSGSLVRVTGSPVDYPFYPMYSDISKNMFFMVGLGYRIWNALHFGVGFSSTTESIALYQLRADNTINYSASAVEARTRTRISFSFLYDFAKKERNPHPLSLYLVYRAKSSLETKLYADISSFVPVQGVLNSTPSFSPSEWILGAAGNIGEHTKLSVDVSKVLWSEYSSPYGTGNINSYVIGTRQASAGFKDVIVPRVGLEHKILLAKPSIKILSYRAGGFYYSTPVPDQTGDTNFVDSKRITTTAGVGLGLKDPWAKKEDALMQFDFFAQWNYLVRRNVTKALANNVGAPGYSSGGSIFVYGLNATFEF